jgi:uncharacterized paraquat-inducible protein A
MKTIIQQTLRRTITFLKALFNHTKRGFPQSSQEQIEKRWKICLSCTDYDSINSQCNICGCNLSNKKHFLNKIAWADQTCPADKW